MLAKNKEDLMERIHKQLADRSEIFSFRRDMTTYEFYYSNENSVFLKETLYGADTVEYSELSFSEFIDRFGYLLAKDSLTRKDITVYTEMNEKYSLEDKVKNDISNENKVADMNADFNKFLSGITEDDIRNGFNPSSMYKDQDAEVWIKCPDNIQEKFLDIMGEGRSEYTELWLNMTYLATEKECNFSFRQDVQETDYNRAIWREIDTQTFKNLSDKFMRVHNEKIVERIKDYFDNHLSEVKIDLIKGVGSSNYLYVEIPMDVMHYLSYSENGKEFFKNPQVYVKFDLTDYDGIYRTIGTLTEDFKDFDLKPLHDTFDKMEDIVLKEYAKHLDSQRESLEKLGLEIDDIEIDER